MSDISNADLSAFFVNAQETSRTRSILAGTCTLVISEFRQKLTKDHGAVVEVTFAVKSSNNEEMRVGDEYGEAYFIEKGKFAATAQGRLKTMIRAIANLPMNVDPDSLREAYILLSGPQQAGRGIEIKGVGVDAVGKDSGKPYVKTNYYAVEGLTAETIHANKAFLNNASAAAPAPITQAPHVQQHVAPTPVAYAPPVVPQVAHVPYNPPAAPEPPAGYMQQQTVAPVVAPTVQPTYTQQPSAPAAGGNILSRLRP